MIAEYTVGTPFMASDLNGTGHADAINGVPTVRILLCTLHSVLCTLLYPLALA